MEVNGVLVKSDVLKPVFSEVIGSEKISNEAKIKIIELLHTNYIMGVKRTHVKDALIGYLDAKAKFLDKWYKNTRKDEGRAYSIGQLIALSESKEAYELKTIEG